MRGATDETKRGGLTRRLVGALALVALVAAGCGAGDDEPRQANRDGTGSGPAPAGTAEATTAPAEGVGAEPAAAPAPVAVPRAGDGTAPGASGGAAPASGRSAGKAGAAPGAAPTAAAGSAGAPSTGREGAAPAPSGEGIGPLPGGSKGGGPKSEIRLGSVGTGSGPIGAAMQSIIHGAKAWVADVNARGGLNGHPVKIIFVDDGGDPQAALALVRRLVEQDKVHALFATHSPTTEHAYAPYAEEKGVAIVGTCGCSHIVDESPVIFQVGPGAPAGATWAHILPFTSLTDKRKVGLLYCREVAVCPKLADGVKKYEQQGGYKVVYEGQISLAQPDFTAEMLAARNAGADVVVGITDNATTIRIARSAHRQNYRPVISTQHSANEDRFITNGGDDVEGALVAAVVPDYKKSAKLADYRAAMARYVPGGVVGSFSAQTYAAGKLLEAVAHRFGDTVASADILEGLYSLKNETLGGLVPPMNFARDKGHGDVNQCIIPARIERGEFVYPFGNRFFCPEGFKPHGT